MIMCMWKEMWDDVDKDFGEGENKEHCCMVGVCGTDVVCLIGASVITDITD